MVKLMHLLPGRYTATMESDDLSHPPLRAVGPLEVRIVVGQQTINVSHEGRMVGHWRRGSVYRTDPTVTNVKAVES